MATDEMKQTIIDAFLAVVSERHWADVSLAAIADRADVPLATLRDSFPDRAAIVAAFVKRIDTGVLEGIDPDLATESGKDRLFDLTMRRFDLLSPHKIAVGALARAARRDAALGLCLAGLAVRSQAWTLEAAGIESTSPRGRLKAKGMAVAYAKVLSVWLDDDDPALARTMSALDKALDRGDDLLQRLDAACAGAQSVLRPFADFARRRRGRDGRGEAPIEPAADPA